MHSWEQGNLDDTRKQRAAALRKCMRYETRIEDMTRDVETMKKAVRINLITIDTLNEQIEVMRENAELRNNRIKAVEDERDEAHQEGLTALQEIEALKSELERLRELTGLSQESINTLLSGDAKGPLETFPKLLKGGKHD